MIGLPARSDCGTIGIHLEGSRWGCRGGEQGTHLEADILRCLGDGIADLSIVGSRAVNPSSEKSGLVLMKSMSISGIASRPSKGSRPW